MFAPHGSWDLSSVIRDGTCALCSVSSLSHWTTREVPIPIFLKAFIDYLFCINYENNLGMWLTMLLGSRNSKHAFFSDHWDLVKLNYVYIAGSDEQIKAMGPLGILEGKV